MAQRSRDRGKHTIRACSYHHEQTFRRINDRHDYRHGSGGFRLGHYVARRVVGMKILLAGATGLVGNQVLSLGLDQGHEVTTVGRRPTGHASSEIVSSFTELPYLPPADVAICALGTTIRQAGSKEAFRAVDHDAVMSFASAAKIAGIEHFLVVTAVGANADASVFYSRVKGEAEQALEKLGFKRLDIIRPGLLLGDRQQNRPVETLLKGIAPASDLLMRGKWRRYRSVQASSVGQCLLLLSEKTEPGVFIHHYDDIMAVLQRRSHDVT